MELFEAKRLAEQLMDRHQLLEWKFKFDNAKLRLGYCQRKRKTISLSKKYVELNNEELIKNTILHEIAHALTEHGHGIEWKMKARQIGCDGERCRSQETLVMVKGKYSAMCNTCKNITYLHRKPKLGRSCGKCDNKYNPKFKLEFKEEEMKNE